MVYFDYLVGWCLLAIGAVQYGSFVFWCVMPFLVVVGGVKRGLVDTSRGKTPGYGRIPSEGFVLDD